MSEQVMKDEIIYRESRLLGMERDRAEKAECAQNEAEGERTHLKWRLHAAERERDEARDTIGRVEALRELWKDSEEYLVPDEFLDELEAVLKEVKCRECDGSGEIEVHYRPLTSNNFESSSMEPCPSCGGD